MTCGLAAFGTGSLATWSGYRATVCSSLGVFAVSCRRNDAASNRVVGELPHAAAFLFGSMVGMRSGFLESLSMLARDCQISDI